MAHFKDVNDFVETLAAHERTIGGLQVQRYDIKALEPDSIVNYIGTANNDIDRLSQGIKLMLPDFGVPLKDNTGSLSLDCCLKVMYEMGPRKKSYSSERRNINWLLSIPKPNAQEGTHNLRVHSFMSNEDTRNIPSDCLSLKKATLCFMTTMDDIVDYFQKKCEEELEPASLSGPEKTEIKRKHVVLTPLAAAAFSTRSVVSIAEGLGLDLGDVNKMINASCASGGHVLERSNPDVAVVSSLNAVKNLADKKLSESIVTKVVKQYSAMGKQMCEANTTELMYMATCGFPEGMSFQSLRDTLNEVDKKSRPSDVSKLDKSRFKVKANTPQSSTSPK